MMLQMIAKKFYKCEYKPVQIETLQQLYLKHNNNNNNNSR